MDTRIEHIELSNQIRDFYNSKYFLPPMPGVRPEWVFDEWRPYVANSPDRPKWMPTTADTFRMWPINSIDDARVILEILTGAPHDRAQIEAVLDDPEGPLYIGVYAAWRRVGNADAAEVG